MKKENTLIIGLTGSFGSGCGEVADYLKKKGFQEKSLTTIIKKEVARQKITSPTRRDLQNIGNNLREKNGNDFLAKEIIKTINRDKNTVVKSIRNDHEVVLFKKTFANFYLLNIDAEKQIRYLRNKTKYTNIVDFESEDERDSGENEPNHGQHVSLCVDKADIVINNNENRKSLYGKIDNYFGIISNPGNYTPPLHELNMAHAWQQGTLSECLKRSVGAIITIGSHIIASGYNSPPEGTPWTCKNLNFCLKDKAKLCEKCETDIQIILPVCNNLKCKTPTNKEQISKLNKNLDLCRSVHAEERAILQTAKIGGHNPNNAVLYTTTFPCLLCAKKIVEVGNIKEVVYIDPYPYREAYDILKVANIKLVKFEGVKSSAFHRLYCKY